MGTNNWSVKLLSLALAVCLLIGMLPAQIFAATKGDVVVDDYADAVLAYAEALISDNESKVNAGEKLTWDTEGKSDYWRYYNGVMLDAFQMAGLDADGEFAKALYEASITERSDEGFGYAINRFYTAATDDKAASYDATLGQELDSIAPARAMFDLLTASGDNMYETVLNEIYKQLTDYVVYDQFGGNFKHKDDWESYEIALDGMYMAQPFLAEYANAVEEGTLKDTNGVDPSAIYAAIYTRFNWVYNNLLDENTGLMNHGFDVTDSSVNGQYWARAIGWYVAALVDVIEYLPADNQNVLKTQLQSVLDGMLEYQDETTGMWYNVVDKGTDVAGNKLETSGTALMAYALMKAYSKGYITDDKYGKAGLKAFNGIVENETDYSSNNGSITTVTNIYKASSVYANATKYCSAANYVADEAKGVGPLIMAASFAKATLAKLGGDPVSAEQAEPDVSVKLAADAACVSVGGTAALNAYSAVGNTTQLPTLTWKSSKDSIAAVDENGVVTGVSAGTATITVTATLIANGVTYTSTDTVTVTVCAIGNSEWVDVSTALFDKVTTVDELNAAVSGGAKIVIATRYTDKNGTRTLGYTNELTTDALKITEYNAAGKYEIASTATQWIFGGDNASGYSVAITIDGVNYYVSGSKANEEPILQADTINSLTVEVTDGTIYTIQINGLYMQLGSSGPELKNSLVSNGSIPDSRLFVLYSSLNYIDDTYAKLTGSEEIVLPLGSSANDVYTAITNAYQVYTTSDVSSGGTQKNWADDGIELNLDVVRTDVAGSYPAYVTVDGNLIATIPVTIEDTSSNATAEGVLKDVIYKLYKEESITYGEKYVIAVQQTDGSYIVLSQNGNNKRVNVTDVTTTDNGNTLHIRTDNNIEFMFDYAGNGDFEDGGDGWTLSGWNPYSHIKTNAWVENESMLLELWLSDEYDMPASASYTTTLDAGVYTFAFDLRGDAAYSGLSYKVTAGDGSILALGDGAYTTTGNWATYETDYFVLPESTEVTFTLQGVVPAKYWGVFDNLRTKEYTVEEQDALENGDLYWYTYWTFGQYSSWKDKTYQGYTRYVNSWSNVNNYGTSFSYDVQYQLSQGTYYFAFEGNDDAGKITVNPLKSYVTGTPQGNISEIADNWTMDCDAFGSAYSQGFTVTSEPQTWMFHNVTDSSAADYWDTPSAVVFAGEHGVVNGEGYRHLITVRSDAWAIQGTDVQPAKTNFYTGSTLNSSLQAMLTDNKNDGATVKVTAQLVGDGMVVAIQNSGVTSVYRFDLPDDMTDTVYISFTGEECTMSQLAVSNEHIPEAYNLISTENVKDTLAVESWWSAHAVGLEITEDIQSWTFNSQTTTPENAQNFHTPSLVVYTATEGVVDTGADYKWYACIRSDNYAWTRDGNDEGTQDDTLTAITTINIPGTNDSTYSAWADWLTANKNGADCKITAQIVDGIAYIAIDNAGVISIYAITLEEDENTLYISLTGEQCTLSDLTVTNEHIDLSGVLSGVITVAEEDERLTADRAIITNGSAIWTDYVTNTFTVSDDSGVDFHVYGENITKGYAFYLDNLKLYKIDTAVEGQSETNIYVLDGSTKRYISGYSNDFETTVRPAYPVTIDNDAGKHAIIIPGTKDGNFYYYRLGRDGEGWRRFANEGTLASAVSSALKNATSANSGLLYLYQKSVTKTDKKVTLDISPKSYSLYTDWSFLPSVEVTVDGEVTQDYEIQWTTSSKKIATVDENGVVTGIKEGQVTITATLVTADGYMVYDENGSELTISDSITVDVEELYYYSIQDDTAVIPLGGTIDFDQCFPVYRYSRLDKDYKVLVDPEDVAFEVAGSNFDNQTPGVYGIDVLIDGKTVKRDRDETNLYLHVTVTDNPVPDGAEVITDIKKLPAYPDPGSVVLDKSATAYTADGQSFKNTGVGEIELSVTGMSSEAAVDVVLIVDISNSMGWDIARTAAANGNLDSQKIPLRNNDGTFPDDKLDHAMDSASDFAQILLQGNNGSDLDNTLSFVTFAGNDHDYGGALNQVDSVQSVFLGVKTYASASTSFDGTKFTNYEATSSGGATYTLEIADENGNIITGLMQLVDEQGNFIADSVVAVPDGYAADADGFIVKDGTPFVPAQTETSSTSNNVKTVVTVEYVYDNGQITRMVTTKVGDNDETTASSVGVGWKGVGGINRGNTNYDYAFGQAIEAVEALKKQVLEDNTLNPDGAADYEELNRELHVVFMTDGAPSLYNGQYLNGKDTDIVWYTDGKQYNAFNTESSTNAGQTAAWLDYIGNYNTLATQLHGMIDGAYSVAFDMSHGGFGTYSWESEDLLDVIRGLSKNGVVPVVEANSAEELKFFYTGLAESLVYAGKNAVVTDYLSSDFTLYTGTQSDAENAFDTVQPRIEIRSYELITQADVDAEYVVLPYSMGGASRPATAADIGQRKRREPTEAEKTAGVNYNPYAYTTYETVIFAADGSVASAQYRNDNGTMKNESLSFTEDQETGVKYLKGHYFTYSFDNSQPEGAKEKFEWRIGNIPQTEMVLLYDAYLTGAYDENGDAADRNAGNYPTNTEATLYFVTADNQYAALPFPEPELPWDITALYIRFHLVDTYGKNINYHGIPSGSILTEIAERLVYEVEWDTASGTYEPIKIPAADVLKELKALSADYGELELYDPLSSYTIFDMRGEPDAKYEITGADNSIVHLGMTDDGSQYGISIAIKIGTVDPDYAVIDYGKPLALDPAENDRDRYETVTLLGMAAVGLHQGIKHGVIYNEGTYGKYVSEVETDEGKFTISDGKVVFTPGKILTEVQQVYAVIKTVDNSIQDAQGEPATVTYYNLIYVVPATVMYYETDGNMVNAFTMDAANNPWYQVNDAGYTIDNSAVETEHQNDGTIGVNDHGHIYGYDDSYAADDQLSNGSGWFVTGEGIKTTTASFTFTGTGFDIISRTNPDQGNIRVTVYGYNEETEKYDKRVFSANVLNKGDYELYQIPVLSKHGLPWGTYVVEIGVQAPAEYTGDFAFMSHGGQFYFDAVRIYDPISPDNANVALVYKTDDEFAPEITEVRDWLLDKETFYNAVNTGGMVEGGAVFVDSIATNAGVSGTDAVNIADYDKVGPNNETYLSQNQAVVFALNAESNAIPASLHIGAKSIRANAAPVLKVVLYAVDGNESVVEKVTLNGVTITSATSRFFDVMAEAGGVSLQDLFGENGQNMVYVLITNTGTDILSITDMKVAYDSDNTASTLKPTVNSTVIDFANAALNANYDVKTITVDSNSTRILQNYRMTVTTGPDVDYLVVTNQYGVPVWSSVYEGEETLADRTWTIDLRPTLLGQQTYTVTGYGTEGENSYHGNPMTQTVYVRLIEGGQTNEEKVQ